MYLSRQQLIWFACLGALALLVGLLYTVPSFLIKSAIEKNGGFYLLPQLTHPTHSDSVIWYIPAAREVADGHLLPSDLHIPANKHLPFFLPPFPLILFGGLIHFLGGPNAAYLAALFIFPAITFLLFYWLARQFFESRLGAVAFGLIGTLTPVAVAYLGRTTETFQLEPILTLKGFIPWVRTPIPELYLSRITEPLLTLPFLILAFGLLGRFWILPSKRRAVLAGIAIALTIYTYLHYFAFLVTFSIVLFLLTLMFRSRFQDRAGWYVFFSAIALGILPFAINYYELGHIPQYIDWALHWSGAFEHWRGIRLSAWRDYLIYLILAIGLIPLGRRDRSRAVFFGAALIAMIVCWNEQIITGFSIVPTHWHKAFGVPAFTIIMVIVAEGATYIQNHPGWRISRRTLTGVLVVLLSLLVVKRTMNALAYVHPDAGTIGAFSFPRRVFDSWQWMEKNIPPEAIVLSPSYVTSLYLTSYTATNPYLPFAEATLATTRELEDRFITTYKLFDVPPERAEILLHGKYYHPTGCEASRGGCPDEHASRNLLKAPQMLYGQMFDLRSVGQDQLPLSYDPYVPMPVIEKLIERYRAAPIPQWENFKGDYVYFGPWERQIYSTNLTANPHLESVFDNGTVQIYRIK